MSSSKEPNFFLVHWGKPITFYEQFFSHFSEEKAIGEATVGYIPYPEVPERIYKVLPDIKFIFTLREPISRAVSHYWWNVNNGFEKRSLDIVLKDGAAAFPIQYGLYYTYISRFLDFFSQEHLHFVIMEKMNRYTFETLGQVYRFLNINDTFHIRGLEAKNRAKNKRLSWISDLVRATSNNLWLKIRIPKAVKPIGIKILNIINRSNTKSFSPSPLRGDQYEFLRSFFYLEIAKLERLLGFELLECKT